MRRASNMISGAAIVEMIAVSFDERDRVVAKRRQHEPNRLRQDDPAHRTRRRHAKRQRGFHLAAVQRLDSGPVYLAYVGGAVHAEADDRGRYRPELDPDLGEPEVDDEELHKRRRAAHHVGIDGRGIAQDPKRREACRCDEEPENERDDEGPDRHLYRHDRGVQQERQDLGQPLPHLAPEFRHAGCGSQRSRIWRRNVRVLVCVGFEST